MKPEKEELPEEGVRFGDGTPFYHIHRRSLTAEQQQRLDQCGIHILKGKFTPKEDEKIQMNWCTYAEEEGIDFDRAFEYAGGFRHQIGQAGEFGAYVKKQISTKFLPRICKGLDNRTARQVTERMRRLFHPARRANDKSFSQWTERDLEMLRIYMDCNTPSSVISLMLMKSKRAVDEKLIEIRGTKKKQEPKEFSWNPETKQALIRRIDFALRWNSNSSEEIKKLQNDIREETNGCDAVHLAISSYLKKSRKCLNWEQIASDLHCTAEEAIDCWFHEAEAIQHLCGSCYFDEAATLKKVSDSYGPMRLMSRVEYRRTLKLIRRQRCGAVAHLDLDLLQKSIEEKELTGYYTKGLKESEYCYMRVKKEIADFRLKYKQECPEIMFLSFREWVKCFIKTLKVMIESKPGYSNSERHRNLRIRGKILKGFLYPLAEKAAAREKAREERVNDRVFGLNLPSQSSFDSSWGVRHTIYG